MYVFDHLVSIPAITNFGNIGNLLPHPPMASDYDSKGFISIDQRKFVLNQAPIALNWSQITLNLLVFSGFIQSLSVLAKS